jgi:hypothetical protein
MVPKTVWAGAGVVRQIAHAARLNAMTKGLILMGNPLLPDIVEIFLSKNLPSVKRARDSVGGRL